MNYITELRSLVGTRPLVLPGAAVIVLDRASRLLLLERADTGGWGLPGGFMDPGESLEETARREVKEETGLDITDLRLINVFSGQDQFYRYPNGDQVFNVTVVYEAQTDEGSLQLDPSEARAANFFPIDQVPADLIAPEVPILEHYRNRRVKGST
ncbi:NUDIX hydrolase [Streptomyces sp. NPDC050164]|uniref:NUDIX hydrolase n=1 Tax=Streptomyces sp. NPDC050164 TaxID=3365605 RepID=UPI0037995A13